jgi:hypothetical protein
MSRRSAEGCVIAPHPSTDGQSVDMMRRGPTIERLVPMGIELFT